MGRRAEGTPGEAGPHSGPCAPASSALPGRLPLAPPGATRCGSGHLAFRNLLRLRLRPEERAAISSTGLPPPKERGIDEGTIHISGVDARKWTLYVAAGSMKCQNLFAKQSGII